MQSVHDYSAGQDGRLLAIRRLSRRLGAVSLITVDRDDEAVNGVVFDGRQTLVAVASADSVPIVGLGVFCEDGHCARVLGWAADRVRSR